MSVDKYKVSICVTTYNHEKFIQRALDSILSQEVNFNYQIVISDDCSTDRTREIILEYKKLYPDKIKAILNDPNLGVVANFFSAITQCDGEYIAILDGDDAMLPQKLQKQVDYLNQNLDCAIVSHQVRVFDSETNKTLDFFKSPNKNQTKFTVEDLINYGNFISSPSKMFRKSSMPKNGIDPNIQFVADWYLSIENALNGNIGFIDECLAEYRSHNKSFMKSINGKNHFEVISYIINSLETRFPGRFSNLFNRNWAYAYLIYTTFHIKNNNFKEARTTIFKSIKNKPFYSLSQYFYLTWAYIPFLGFIFKKIR
ncbi:MAG: glycosyltransferase [Bacteroidetes bacterium]|nr:glycosyltransferase [Bacteroidota bacterium]